MYRLSCEHLAHRSPTLNPFDLQFVAETSLLSIVCVTIIITLIGVRPTSIHVPILIDEMFHSETYVGIGRRSQTGIGRCFGGMPISIWSACPVLCCLLLGSLKFHDSFRFLCSTFYKHSVASSVSDGLTTGSSRQGTIAQHKALSNKLGNWESP